MNVKKVGFRLAALALLSPPKRGNNANRARFVGNIPTIDTAPHLPGKPGSKERIEFLATYYGRQTNEISPFE